MLIHITLQVRTYPQPWVCVAGCFILTRVEECVIMSRLSTPTYHTAELCYLSVFRLKLIVVLRSPRSENAQEQACRAGKRLRLDSAALLSFLSILCSDRTMIIVECVAWDSSLLTVVSVQQKLRYSNRTGVILPVDAIVFF